MSDESWRASSYSSSGANCVEVRAHAAGADVRDTRNRPAGYLAFDRAEWSALLAGIRTGC